MELKHHKTLTLEKWRTFSFEKQILMIGNELNRAKNWIERGDQSEVTLCYEKAMELLFLTIPGIKKRTMLFELLRFRDVLAGLYLEKTPSASRNASLFNVLISLSPMSYSLLFAKHK